MCLYCIDLVFMLLMLLLMSNEWDLCLGCTGGIFFLPVFTETVRERFPNAEVRGQRETGHAAEAGQAERQAMLRRKCNKVPTQ